MSTLSVQPFSVSSQGSHRILEVASSLRTSPEGLLKMIKNGAKAIYEGRDGSLISKEVFERIAPLYQILEHSCLNGDVTVDCSQSSLQGKRPAMEDASFVCLIESREGKGVLAGVFDGHGGSAVARCANEHFGRLFALNLSEKEGNVREAFVSTFDDIAYQVKGVDHWLSIGSTAVVVYIQGSVVYTATLGDSEARNYRGDQEIRLSCVRNWASPKDANRAYRAYLAAGLERLAEQTKNWPQALDVKEVRFPGGLSGGGLNVSRAFGDCQYRGAVSSKPKISIQVAEPGDKIVIASDGLWDFVSGDSVKGCFKVWGKWNLATQLAQLAISQGSSDNVTVIVLDVESRSLM